MAARTKSDSFVTDEMRESAKDYLRRRLDNEDSYAENLDTWLREAIEKICAVIVKYALTAEQMMNNQIPEKAQREIDAIIDELSDEIAEAVLLLAKDERDNDDWFVNFLLREFEDGWTFSSRLEQYAKNFGKQVVMGVAALSLLDIASKSWASSIEGNMRAIYDAPFVKAVARERLSYFSPMKLGRGVPHNMSVALEFLGRQSIANAWMQWSYEEAKKSGAEGYFIFRGSSYPCDFCDDECRWHDISEPYPLPIHPNCYCYVVYDMDALKV